MRPGLEPEFLKAGMAAGSELPPALLTLLHWSSAKSESRETNPER